MSKGPNRTALTLASNRQDAKPEAAAQRLRGASLASLVTRYVSAAQQDPERAPEICRQASRILLGAATNPRNAQMATQLERAAQEFARAASRPATSDDFHELLADTAQATAEVDEQDEQGIVARRREIYDERNPEAPHVCIAPQTITRDATLGRVATIKYGPEPSDTQQGIVQSTTIAYWQGAKREAQAVTVDVCVVKAPQASSGSLTPVFARPYGEVEFGSDGNTTKVRFDIGGGVRFTVAGNYVSVNVGMDANTVGTISGQMTLGCSMGMFAAPSQAPIFRTLYVDNLAAAGSTELLPRPTKAVQLMPLVSTAIGGTATLEFLDYTTTTIYQLSITNGSLPSPIPLANDVAYIRLTNTGGAQASFRLIFKLSM